MIIQGKSCYPLYFCSMVKSRTHTHTLSFGQLIAGVCIIIAAWLLLWMVKTAFQLQSQKDRFSDTKNYKGDAPPPIFVFAYSPEPGCTRCPIIEPIWDDFVTKNAARFRELVIIPNKLVINPDEQSSVYGGSKDPSYPSITLINIPNFQQQFAFKGPYTEAGLTAFFQTFERNHPRRLSRWDKFRKDNPELQKYFDDPKLMITPPSKQHES